MLPGLQHLGLHEADISPAYDHAEMARMGTARRRDRQGPWEPTGTRSDFISRIENALYFRTHETVDSLTGPDLGLRGLLNDADTWMEHEAMSRILDKLIVAFRLNVAAYRADLVNIFVDEVFQWRTRHQLEVEEWRATYSPQTRMQSHQALSLDL